MVKKLIGGDTDDKTKFAKEARLLNAFDNKNTVRFEGLCKDPLSIMLEYVYFDFAPFLEEKSLRATVSSLEDFLIKLDELDAPDGLPLQDKVVNDVVNGLKYLHKHAVSIEI